MEPLFEAYGEQDVDMIALLRADGTARGAHALLSGMPVPEQVQRGAASRFATDDDAGPERQGWRTSAPLAEPIADVLSCLDAHEYGHGAGPSEVVKYAGSLCVLPRRCSSVFWPLHHRMHVAYCYAAYVLTPLSWMLILQHCGALL